MKSFIMKMIIWCICMLTSLILDAVGKRKNNDFMRDCASICLGAAIGISICNLI